MPAAPHMACNGLPVSPGRLAAGWHGLFHWLLRTLCRRHGTCGRTAQRTGHAAYRAAHHHAHRACNDRTGGSAGSGSGQYAAADEHRA